MNRSNFAQTCSLTVSGAGGLDNQAPQTCSISAANPGVVTLNNHGFPANASVVLGGSVPTGLSVGVPYRVINPTTNTFQLTQDWIGTASFATNVMTIQSTVSGTPSIGQLVTAASVQVGTTITGGTGPWTLSTSPGTIGTENATGTLTGPTISTASGTLSATATVASVLSANSWYSVWSVYNPQTQTDSLMASSSLTNPVLQSGYLTKALVSMVRTDATASKYPLSMSQMGDRVQYKVAAGGNTTSPPSVVTGVFGSWSSSWASISVAPFVPPNARSIKLSAFSSTYALLAIAPNSSYAWTVDNIPFYTCVSATFWNVSIPFELNLEAQSIGVVLANAAHIVRCLGFSLNF